MGGDLPDDPGVGPATNGAVQSYTLLLPHGVGAGLDHKLWRVHQAVLVHALEVLPVFMDLQSVKVGGDTEDTDRAGTGTGKGARAWRTQEKPLRRV